MRLLVVAVGRLKQGGERVLVDRYIERMASARGQPLGPATEKELSESKLGSARERQADEATRLLASAEDCDCLVALDERGKTMSSAVFSQWLDAQRGSGVRRMAFLVGGADGHGAQVISRAKLVLSLGPMTLPHGLARAVLVEQIYRAGTILAGHPYHRV